MLDFAFVGFDAVHEPVSLDDAPWYACHTHSDVPAPRLRLYAPFCSSSVRFNPKNSDMKTCSPM